MREKGDPGSSPDRDPESPDSLPTTPLGSLPTRTSPDLCGGGAREAEAAQRSQGLGELDPLCTSPHGEDYLAHYELHESAGHGSMGTVYRARDTLLDRQVAVKVLADELSNDPALQDRFVREARIIARLSHPNLPQIHFVGRSGGRLFFAMEWIGGETLEALARRGRLPVERVLDLARQAASGLAAAHRAGIIHRDIKPSNIMLTPEGVAKILDFGIARSVVFDTGATAVGQFIGTAHYASPEQASGRRLDHRSDLYSLGATLYELLSGRPPFEGESGIAVLTARLMKPPPELPGDVTCEPRVRQLIRSMMAREPAERPASADEVVRLIDEVYPGPPMPARYSRRWFAGLTDLLLLLIPPAALGALFFRVKGYFLTTLLYDSVAGRVALAAGALAWLLAYFVLLADRRGRTFGQRLETIHTSNRNGTNPSRRQLLMRTLVAWGPVCVLMALQPDWPPPFDPDRERFVRLWLAGGESACVIPGLELMARSNGPLFLAALWALATALVPLSHRRGWGLADRLSRTEVMEPAPRSRAGGSARDVEGGAATRRRAPTAWWRLLANVAVLVVWGTIAVVAMRQIPESKRSASPWHVESVAPGDPGWSRLLARFQRSTLRSDERFLNPEALIFRRRFLSLLFSADTRAQVKIENRAYGVSITREAEGWNLFGFYNNTDESGELAPRDSIEAKRWDENRRAAYRGSFMHFCRALMHQRLADEGFEVLNPKAFVGLYREGDHFILVAWPRLDVKVAGAPRPCRVFLYRGSLRVFENGGASGSWGIDGWLFLDEVPHSATERYAAEQDSAWGKRTRDIREVLELR